MSLPLAEARVAIVGLGLMGASLGYDLRGRCRQVIGVVRRPQAAAAALAAGCVDTATTDALAAARTADLVVLATPVRVILQHIASLGPRLQPAAVLLDLGSTKLEICRALEALPAGVQAIGGHPMCGKEQAGLEAAEAGLYRGCTFVLCPLPRTSQDTLALVHELIAHVGAHPLILDPARHDRLVAAISHLPYLAACALVRVVMGVGESDPAVWSLAAGGFRDSTRVAASDVDMLLDILITNRQQLMAALEAYQAGLAALAGLLQADDESALRAALEGIAAARRAWNVRRAKGR